MPWHFNEILQEAGKTADQHICSFSPHSQKLQRKFKSAAKSAAICFRSSVLVLNNKALSCNMSPVIITVLIHNSQHVLKYIYLKKNKCIKQRRSQVITFLSCSSEVHVVRMQVLLCELNICTDQNVVLQKEEHQNVFTSQLSLTV